jgi:non-lysosomal glucosylceramidase
MFGAGSYSGSLWLAALEYAVKAAGVMRDRKAEARYSELLDRARETFERKLWNGSYYRLYNDEGGERGDLDEGCLVDQLIGQWATDMIGAGPIVRRERVRKALRRIMKLCFRPGQGLRNAGWPGDGFLHPVDKDVWVDQANTCWTGVELAFASFLIYEGFVREGLKIVRNVDRRYRKAGMYWDHQEFGGHYYRPMSAWAIMNALAGLTIHGDTYGFSPKLPGRDQRLFFAFGSGTAHLTRKVKGRSERLAVEVRTGTFRCRELAFALLHARPGKVTVTVAGKRLPPSSYDAGFEEEGVRLRLRRGVSVGAGESVAVELA